MMWAVLLQSDYAEIYLIVSCKHILVDPLPKLQWQIEQRTPAAALPLPARIVEIECLCVEKNKSRAKSRACGGLRSLMA
jgi:hypothetical protein